MASTAVASTARTMAPADIRRLGPSWRRSLEAANRSHNTVLTYTEGLRQFTDFIVMRGMPTEVDHIRHAHIEAFLADILSRRKAATASNRYRAVQAFFRWCEEEGEVTASPMAKMRPPHVPEQPVPVFTGDELRRLLKACEGSGFDERRDRAIVHLLLDTGCRRGELVGLRVDDIDLDQRTVTLLGKGRRVRHVAFGRRTSQTLDRYLRARDRHRHADDPALWLGLAGPLGDSGVAIVLRRRAKAGWSARAPCPPAPSHVRPQLPRRRRERG